MLSLSSCSAGASASPWQRSGASGRCRASKRSQGGQLASSLYATTGNNSKAASSCGGCGSRARPLCDLGEGTAGTGPKGPGVGRRPRRKRPAGGGGPGEVADLMCSCTQRMARQAGQMRVRGTDCQQDNPYAGLKTGTFRKLLRSTGGRRTAKPGKAAKKTKWCRPKIDECDGIRLQLCPHLGEGHTHEKVIDEVTPLLLRTAMNVKCQLREICRRLFFMKHNVPQLTAPTLVNFHAILAEVTQMLIADFSSFPTGLKLPDRRHATPVQR